MIELPLPTSFCGTLKFGKSGCPLLSHGIKASDVDELEKSSVKRGRISCLQSGLKKTRAFRFLLLEDVVLDWFMRSSCLFWWSFACQNLAVNARNRAELKNEKVTF